MSVAAAQAAAGQLRTALLDHGVRQVSLELQAGVSTSGWNATTFKRGMGHHIVSRPSQGRTPGLALVKRGRPDLGGPLCNGYGGFDLVARVITMGWANHPGAGGPWPVPGWGTIPRDNGRPYIFGWEFEGGLEPYTDAMHDFMARCGAGTLDWLGTLPGNPGPAPLDCWGEHKDPWAPGRKVDRLGYTAASGRNRIRAVREDDMPLTDADVEKIWSFALITKSDPRGYGYGGRDRLASVDYATQVTLQKLSGLEAAVSKMATAIANDDEITADELRAAVRDEVDRAGQVPAEHIAAIVVQSIASERGDLTEDALVSALRRVFADVASAGD